MRVLLSLEKGGAESRLRGGQALDCTKECHDEGTNTDMVLVHLQKRLALLIRRGYTDEESELMQIRYITSDVMTPLAKPNTPRRFEGRLSRASQPGGRSSSPADASCPGRAPS